MRMVTFESQIKAFDDDGNLLGDIECQDYDRANGLPIAFCFAPIAEMLFDAGDLRAIADKLDELNGAKG